MHSHTPIGDVKQPSVLYAHGSCVVSREACREHRSKAPRQAGTRTLPSIVPVKQPSPTPCTTPQPGRRWPAGVRAEFVGPMASEGLVMASSLLMSKMAGPLLLCGIEELRWRDCAPPQALAPGPVSSTTVTFAPPTLPPKRQTKVARHHSGRVLAQLAPSGWSPDPAHHASENSRRQRQAAPGDPLEVGTLRV